MKKASYPPSNGHSASFAVVAGVIAFTCSGITLASSSPDSDVEMLSAEQSVSVSTTVFDQVQPTLLVGIVGLPEIDRARQLPTGDLDAFGGKRSITKAVKAAAKQATKATPNLAKVTSAINAVKGVPAVTALTVGAPVAWALGSKIGEKVYGQPAGPYPGLIPALVGK